MNVDKLLGKMKEKGYTQELLAQKIKMAVPTFKKKISKKSSNRFYIDEVKQIKKVLNLNNKETLDIFLN